MYLEKIASAHTSRLEKIAAAIAAAEAGEDLDKIAEEISRYGITEKEIDLAMNLFAGPENQADMLQKVAETLVSEESTPLEKVAAAVDLTVAGVISPDDAYAAAQELGFSPRDVDYIYDVAYGGESDGMMYKYAGATNGVLSKIKQQLLDIARAQELREGLGEMKRLKGKPEFYKKLPLVGKRLQRRMTEARKKALAGAAKTGALYGVPIAGGAAGYAALSRDDDQE